MLPSHVQSENNLLSGMSDIITSLERQHKEEMKLVQKNHNEVVLELKQQALDAQKSYLEQLAAAYTQVKWSRYAFYIALLTLLINLFFYFLK